MKKMKGIKKMFFKIGLIFMATVFVTGLVGCAPSGLDAPCPNFGAYCKHKAVNDRYQVD